MKKVSLFSSANAISSLRSSGFDFSTAIGEFVDNSIQANACTITINTIPDKAGKSIESVSILDDGCGMSCEVLHNSLRLGFSTRYNDRNGIGRFGVGATLAAISQCKKISIFSKQDSSISKVCIDIDNLSPDSEVFIDPPINENCENLKKYNSGTYIIWEKCDKLIADANNKPLNKSKLDNELKEWIERTYRKFIDKGLVIYLNDQKLNSYDPLYLNIENTIFPNDPKATVFFEHILKWDVPGDANSKSPILIRLTLLPEELRQNRYDGDSEFAIKRRINTNEGASILRLDREVAYGNFYPMLPASQAPDRYWGLEISFMPELDECWDVKNVKRGARATEELRTEIKKLVAAPISQVRSYIKTTWDKKQTEEDANNGDIHISEKTVADAEKKYKPKSQSGDTNEKEKEKIITNIVDRPDIPEDEKAPLEKKLKNPELPITVSTSVMHGPDFFIPRHLGNGKVHIEFNYGHKFFEIYNELKDLEKNSTSDISLKIQKARIAVDLLLMAFGRAESMIDLTDEKVESVVTSLRTFWGMQLHQYIRSIKSE